MENKSKKIIIMFVALLFMIIINNISANVLATINVTKDTSVETINNLMVNKIPAGSETEGAFFGSKYGYKFGYTKNGTKISTSFGERDSDIVIHRHTHNLDGGTGRWLDEMPLYCDSQGNAIYCVQGTHNISTATPGDHKIVNITEANIEQDIELLKKLELIGYYGWNYNENGYDHSDEKWRVATQVLIWKNEHPRWDFDLLTTLSWEVEKYKTTAYDGKMNEIMDLVNKHYVEPNFSDLNQKVYIGKSVTITDTNNVLSNYEVNSKSNNVEVEKNGNTITFTATSPEDAYIQLVRKSTKFGKPTTFYVSDKKAINSPVEEAREKSFQNMMQVGDFTPSVFNITFKAEGIKLNVCKTLQSTTGNLGDATARGAIYGIYSDSNCTREVARITVGENGYSNKTEYLPYQDYYAKEILNTSSTQLDETVYTINADLARLDAEGDFGLTLNVSDWVNESIIKIHKKLGATDYDQEINLKGSKFKLTLKSDSTQTYETTQTDESGICEVRNVPYGTYIVSEIQCPDEAYAIEDFEIVVEKDKYTYTYEKVDPSKMMKIAVNKKLLDETVGKTDAEVSNAYFTVYTDAAATIPYTDKNGRVVVIGPTNKEGYAISGTMRTGTYYLKETTFPIGINPNALMLGETVTYRNKVYEASYDNRRQGTDIVTVSFERLVNVPNFGRIRVIKYKDVNDSSDEIPAVGARLRLTLISSKGSVYYDGVVDENGYCEFIKEDVRYISPTYTIPYGRYEITELDEGGDAHKYYFIQPENVDIVNEGQDEKRIVSDNPVPAWLKIIKKDRLTSLTVKLEGAEYAIWDLQENKFVEQMSYEDGGVISRYKTNKDGYLVTPEKVQPGDYVIYETQAPEGYYLQDEWRLPDNTADYGKVGGKRIRVDKITTNIPEDTTYPEGGVVTGETILDTTIDDVPLTVNLELYKTGEKFTGATSKKVTYPVSETENRDEDLYTPVYKELPLQGVGYKIYAVRDTYTPDGIKRYSKDQMVADITTDENGYAVAEKLFPGEYRIEEYKTPKGYLKDENIPNVILENKDQYLETATVKKELTDERQKLGLTFKKEYEEVKYSDEEELVQKSLFGVYTKETLNNYQGTATIGRNSLVELIWADDENDVTSKADLPEGTYYVKELYVTYPYNIDINTYDYNLEYTNNSSEKVVIVRGRNLVNTPTTTTLTLVKIGTTSVDELIVSGDVIDTTGLDEKVQRVINELNGKTREEIKEYFKENNVKTVSGAEYGIYTDEECTKTLKVKNNETGKYEDVTLTSDELGLIELEDIPVRTYYLKELKAPAMYKKSDKVIKVELDNVNKDGMVYNAIIEEEVVPHLITKTDIFTSEVVPNCVFEIRDKEGTLILKSITNENGEASIPISIFDKGEKYTYTEIEAPSIYELNKEPHEFVADYNDMYEWIDKIKVENTRKSKELRVLKVDDETGEPLKGCVFSIVLLDENGEPKTREDGSIVYLVENGVTDENGEYLIEKAYYGTYKFTEIEAPEGYEMNEESMEGYVFTIDDNSPDRIDFVVTNTGDIAVIALASILVVCAIGIVSVFRKKYNKQ